MKHILIISFAVFMISSCENGENVNQATKIDSLEVRVNYLSQERDSLQQLLTQRPSSALTGWFYPSYDGPQFIKRGIEDPEAYIKEALKSQPEIIPLDPVLGGTMRFVRIDVLSEKWVIAQYEDGHVTGKALYSYELQEDGSVRFKIIDSVNG